MSFLQNLLDSTNIPILSAFLLGLLTAICPCPLATNVAAVGYLSKDIESRHKIFWNGLLYTLGRIIAYTTIGLILIPILKEGASIFSIQKSLSKYGEMFLAPALILIGVFMLFSHKLHLHKVGYNGNGGSKLKGKGGLGSLALGVLFALAFCPSSGVFFFAMLIPMAAIESNGYILPVIFALGTGLPVMLVSWVLAYSFSSIGKVYNRIQTVQKWVNKIVAVLFIIIGLYYALTFHVH